MIEQNHRVYSKEAKDFAEASYWRFDEEYLVNKYFTSPKERSILVLGCGGGRVLPPLYKKGFKKISAIDIVEEMIVESRNKISGMDIDLRVMDACDLKYEDDSFDYVFFPFHGLDCVYPDIYVAVREAARVLKPGGVFIFNSHNRYYLKGLKRFFAGEYIKEENGLVLYRTDYRDKKKLKKIFTDVEIKQRISMQPWNKSNWKDVCYKLLPILNKSTYYICKNPIK